jgi:metal-dependent amidase/aminoacylase/carboxypeptidase family protein
MLEAGAEVVNVGILVKDTQTLVDHSWSQGSLRELRESSAELLDDGVERIVAGIKNAHGMVVSTVPFLG